MINTFSEQVGEVATALGRVQAALGGSIPTTGKANVGKFKYSYVELDVLFAKVVPLLKDNGLTVLHTQDAEGVDCFLVHTTGQWVKTRAQVGVPNTADAQARGSAFTYGRRYAMMAMLGLAAGDDDGAAAKDLPASPPPEPEAPTHATVQLEARQAQKRGWTTPLLKELLKRHGAEKITDISTEAIPAVLAELASSVPTNNSNKDGQANGV